MLVTDYHVRAAHARRDLPEGLRYAVVRLAELLDPETPFALSGCAFCEPLAATRAFASAAGDYLAHPGVRFGTALAASQLLSDALEQEVNLRAWYPGDLSRLLLFLAQLRRVPAVKTVGGTQLKVPYHERTTWVRQKLTALVTGSLARFQTALHDGTTGYRTRLLDSLSRRLCRAPASERDWAELDHDLCYAAALLLGDGRDGGELARAVARRVAGAADAVSAVTDIRAFAEAEPATHHVVVTLGGVRSLAPGSAAGFGVEVLDPDRPRWPAPAGPAAARALVTFAADRAPTGAAVLVMVRVEARDAEQARLRGRLAAEALQDHLVAAHPAASPRLEPEALVLDPAGRARRLGGPPRPLRDGRATAAAGAKLHPFLRANALARRETSPVLRILHAWIALEYLASGGGLGEGDRPALSHRLESYLPPHLAAVAALAGVHDQLRTSWAEVRGLALRSSRRADWLEAEARFSLSGDGPPNPARLSDLLAVAAGVGPFARRRLEILHRQFAKGSRLAKAAEAIQVRTLIAIARLKLARHLAVHQGFNADQATPALALSALQLLDSVFMVLRHWLSPAGEVGQALSEARSWHDRNLTGWRSVAEMTVDMDHLLHPGAVGESPRAPRRATMTAVKLQEALSEHEVSSLYELDRTHWLHPQGDLGAGPTVVPQLMFSYGQGATLTDVHGRTYIDGMASLWNVHVGYGRADLAEAAAEQMRALAFSNAYGGFGHAPGARLAERLADMAPGELQVTFFASGGAEANDTAYKLARLYWRLRGEPERVNVVSRLRAYHGLTYGATSATGMPVFKKDFGPLAPGFLHAPAPDPYRYQGGDGSTSAGAFYAQALEDVILAAGPATVAAVVAEPVQGAGGVIVPPSDYFPRVREVCNRHGLLLIADEVITGFGRTGKWFGVQQWDVAPDLMVFAKGVTSGYLPLSGVMLTRQVHEVLSSLRGTLAHGFTYSGHPTSCAVALRNLQIIEEEGLVARAGELGRQLLAGLEGLRRHEVVGDVRGLGLLAGVELVKDRATRESFDPAVGAARRVCLAALEQGVIVRPLPGDVIAMCPPLVISREQVDRLVEALDAALGSVATEL